MRTNGKFLGAAAFLALMPGIALAQQATQAAPFSANPIYFPAYWITTIIAVLALAMPGIKWLFRRWINRITLFTENWIEVNFTAFGPLIGLLLTVHGTPLDQFVRRISGRVTRKRDSATLALDWAALRPLTLLPGDIRDLKAATGFKLAAGDAVPLNVAFVAHDSRQRVQAQLRTVRDAWVNHLRGRNLIPAQMQPQQLQQEWQQFSNGSVSPIPAQVHQEIARFLYWEEGNYDLSLVIETYSPAIRRQIDRRFSLTREQVDQIRLGVIGAMMATCDQPAAVPTMAYPALEE